MTRTSRRAALLLAVVAAFAVVLTGAATVTAAESLPPPSPIKFLTGPQSGQPTDIALAYLRAHASELRGANVNIDFLRISDRYTDDNGTTYIYFQQTTNGTTPIARAVINTAIADDGSVITVGDRTVDQPAPSPLAPTQDSADAERAALDHAGEGAKVVGQPELEYVQTDDGLRLAWLVQVTNRDGDWLESQVDARTAALLGATNYVADATEGSKHNVFPVPFESPSETGRVVVNDPADPVASPFGWNDTNGATGAEFTITRGNNAFAYVDASNDNLPDPGSSPDGGPTLNFDFPLDLGNQQPTQYRPFAVSNLYYLNNIVHDVLHHAGFDEPAGNFQEKNYSGVGVGNDSVNAEAQDGSGLNNANFGTPPEGMRPRMQMFVWRSSTQLTVTSPASIAGNYTTGSAGFGPPFGATGITGEIVLALDDANAAGPRTDDACTAITNPAEITGKIAIVRRGTCEFATKVENVQIAGAIAAIIQNNVAGPAITLGSGVRGPFVTIPATGMSLADGDTIRGALPASGTIKSLFNDRDSDLDNGVIAHEYGHGWSNRLTGGPANVGCLQSFANPPTNTIPLDLEQMGEGWSDFLALVVTAKASDTATKNRGIGTYVSFQPTDGIGIRPTQYTTDLTVNPSTYDTLKLAPNPLTIPHGVGYVWASTLWEVYWNLVNQYGFNADLYDSWDSGGNNLALRLVSDGMKIQPCLPGFVDGRNGILLADQALTGGENQCLIWRGFAKRGLGLNAQQGGPISTSDGTQDFTLPLECVTPDIDVSPSSLSATQLRGKQTTRTVTIENTALYGSVNADATITEAVSDCASPSNVPWLSESAATKSVAPQASDSVDVTLSSTGLAVGTHTAKLCVASNDPDEGIVSIPVTLNVIYAYTQQALPGGANAGRTIPVRFSLDGNEGLAIFAAGYPKVRPCGGGTTVPAQIAGGLAYDATTNTYQLNWKTDSAWAGSCRELVLGLKDGTTKTVPVNFS